MNQAHGIVIAPSVINDFIDPDISPVRIFVAVNLFIKLPEKHITDFVFGFTLLLQMNFGDPDIPDDIVDGRFQGFLLYFQQLLVYGPGAFLDKEPGTDKENTVQFQQDNEDDEDRTAFRKFVFLKNREWIFHFQLSCFTG